MRPTEIEATPTPGQSQIIAAYQSQEDPAVQKRLDELNAQNNELRLALARQEAVQSCPVMDRMTIYNEIKAEYTAEEKERMRAEAKALYKEEARQQCVQELQTKKDQLCKK